MRSFTLLVFSGLPGFGVAGIGGGEIHLGDILGLRDRRVGVERLPGVGPVASPADDRRTGVRRLRSRGTRDGLRGLRKSRLVWNRTGLAAVLERDRISSVVLSDSDPRFVDGDLTVEVHGDRLVADLRAGEPAQGVGQE